MDDPNTSPTAFLRSVMHDRTAPIRDRVRAAKALLKIEGPNGPPHLQPPSLTIRIHLPHALEMQRLWESFSPEMQKDLMYLKRCYDQGIEGPFDIADMQVKGHG
jgi:hypothetical protein